MRPKAYHLARIEPREELSVHLLPLEGKHGLCGVNIWSKGTVEVIEPYSYYTIAEFLDRIHSGEINVRELTCERCIEALAREHTQANA